MNARLAHSRFGFQFGMAIATASSVWAALGTPVPAGQAPRPEVVIADFEGDDYGTWTTAGQAFGTAPARGTLANQMPVSGFLGRGLVNSYLAGDGPLGRMTSGEIKIERKRINFLIGGGRHPDHCYIRLVVGGKEVRRATGRDTEHLNWHSWEVSEFEGKPAAIEIVDEASGGWGHINVDQIVATDEEPQIVDERDDLLARAEASLAEARAKFGSDPNRPRFHVQPAAFWNNDPNGPLLFDGWYHLFYQHNPYGDGWGNMHWGHVRSRNLVRWEHQPIALWPSKNLGEDHVFSGCATIGAGGRPILFYTSIGPRRPEQWAAVPEDNTLVRWKKHAANPILTEELHGDQKVHEWRDPFVFHHEGRTFLVTGGNLNAGQGGQAIVGVYEALADDLTRWRYRGVLFQHPDPDVKNIECPLFFPLGDQWVLITSQGRPVQYFVGRLDGHSMRFTPENRGVMDFGNYYAPNVLVEADQTVLWGWVTDFPGGNGWNGCLTVPRELSLSADGHLRQEPIAGLALLRKDPFTVAQSRVLGTHPLGRVDDAVLECRVQLGLGSATRVGMRLADSTDPARAITVAWDGQTLDVQGTRVPLALLSDEDRLDLTVLLDRTVLEVYANRRACVTRVVERIESAVDVSAWSEGGACRLAGGGLWPLETIWMGSGR